MPHPRCSTRPPFARYGASESAEGPRGRRERVGMGVDAQGSVGQVTTCTVARQGHTQRERGVHSHRNLDAAVA